MVTHVVSSLASGTKPGISKGEKCVRVFLFYFCLFFLSAIVIFPSYALFSTLFTSTTVFLPNYSSGNIRTDSIQPVWHFLQVVWHFLLLTRVAWT